MVPSQKSPYLACARSSWSRVCFHKELNHHVNIYWLNTFLFWKINTAGYPCGNPVLATWSFSCTWQSSKGRTETSKGIPEARDFSPIYMPQDWSNQMRQAPIFIIFDWFIDWCAFIHGNAVYILAVYTGLLWGWWEGSQIYPSVSWTTWFEGPLQRIVVFTFSPCMFLPFIHAIQITSVLQHCRSGHSLHLRSAISSVTSKPPLCPQIRGLLSKTVI